MSIAGLYGARLLSIGQNIDKSKLPRLISDYPSHGYVIDRNAELSDGALKLIVEDDGPGIPEDKREAAMRFTKRRIARE